MLSHPARDYTRPPLEAKWRSRTELRSNVAATAAASTAHRSEFPPAGSIPVGRERLCAYRIAAGTPPGTSSCAYEPASCDAGAVAASSRSKSRVCTDGPPTRWVPIGRDSCRRGERGDHRRWQAVRFPCRDGASATGAASDRPSRRASVTRRPQQACLRRPGCRPHAHAGERASRQSPLAPARVDTFERPVADDPGAPVAVLLARQDEAADCQLAALMVP